MEVKVGNKIIEDKVLEILSQEAQPVSVDLIRYRLGTSWVTARALLMSMALTEKISAQKTSKSWIFFPNQEAKTK
jgi:hypothetical protein